MLPACLECRIELDRSLKMFFSKLVHPEVLQSEADHPMVKRIVAGELVGLLFMSDPFFGSTQQRCGACELIIRQNKARISL